MKSQKTDRRSMRTQRLLGEALIALLIEKRYDDITIQHILDRANMGRSTFYEHYWDKVEAHIGRTIRNTERPGGKLHALSKHSQTGVRLRGKRIV